LVTNDGGQLQFRPSEVMPGIRKILRQGSIYSITKALLLMFSIVTFPIFTRVLSKEEYGLMHLITIVLMMAGLICSGDLKDAILRFYGECERRNELRLLISNTFTGSLLIGIVGYLLTVLVAFVMFEFGIISNFVFKIIVISFLAIIAGNIITPIQTIYRVREEALKYNVVSLVSKLMTTGLCIAFVVYLSKGVYGLFVGQVISDGLIAATLFILFMKKYGLGTLSISPNHLKIFLKYSSPLIVNGIFVYLTNFGDRFLIATYLDQSSIATYAVAYALPDYIQTAVILSLNMVLYPVIMNLWGMGKDKEAEVMLGKFLIIYVVVAIPMVFGLISLRYEIIEVLASKKYVQAAELITVLTLGIMIRGLEFPLTAGLYKVKRTNLIALVNMGGVIVNGLLNVVLIPVLGLKGAAFATLGSYLAVLFVSYRLSRKYEKITINFREVMKFTAISISISAIMFVALNFINMKPLGLIYDLSCKIVVGILIYCCGVFVFVKKIAKFDKKMGL
jgi:O-antigen/teichoic acid export membrane protein